MSDPIYLPELKEPIFTEYIFETPQEPTTSLTKTYTIHVEQDGEKFIGTCLELENIFVDGIDEEDVMRRIRIVIEEFLEHNGIHDKEFNVIQLVTFSEQSNS